MRAARLVAILTTLLMLVAAWASLSDAAPTRGMSQLRHDQLSMFDHLNGVWSCEYSAVYQKVPTISCPARPGEELIGSLELDAASYPTTTMFRFEVTGVTTTQSTACFRLYDNTTASAVTGSELCRTNSDTSNGFYYRARSVSFSLPSGAHEYVVQVAAPAGFGGYIFAARIIADW